MGTKVQISPEEYLHTSFENPDREYVNGEVVERPMPNTSHSYTQGLFVLLIGGTIKRRALFILPELRLKLWEGHFRIADVSVFQDRKPAEEVPSSPPFIVIEIVSPDDSYSELVQKLDEYWKWGVKHVWLADPATRKVSVYDSAGLHEVHAFTLPEFDLTIRPGDLF